MICVLIIFLHECNNYVTYVTTDSSNSVIHLILQYSGNVSNYYNDFYRCNSSCECKTVKIEFSADRKNINKQAKFKLQCKSQLRALTHFYERKNTLK